MKRTARRDNSSSKSVSKRHLTIAKETIKQLTSDGLLNVASGCPTNSLTTEQADTGGG